MARYRLCGGLAIMPEHDMAMLADMSARGWHLSGFSCGILYRFEAGEPHAYDYAVDFQRDFSAEAQELYRIGGWQSVALGSSWQIVRAEAGTVPLYTDDDAQAETIGASRAGLGWAALVCALAAWIWGHWGGLRASGPQKLFTGALALLMVCGSIWWSVQPAPEPAPWETFRADTFRSLLKKEPLMVEFTADWCPSCKFLEQTVLTPKRLHAITERYGLRLIKVDLTRPDPEAQALLRAIGSVSIPVTAIFPKGLLSNSPIVLRDLYTASQLEDALATLSPRK